MDLSVNVKTKFTYRNQISGLLILQKMLKINTSQFRKPGAHDAVY